MKFGYARVSTRDQNLNLQIDALKKEGCEQIFHETASGAKSDRPQLKKLLDRMRKDDVMVIWKLDRLGRSLKHLVTLISELLERKIGLKSLNDPIDTTHSQGRLVFNIFASLAEFERDLISERTQAGLKAARARGRLGGRPKGLSDKAKSKAAVAAALYRDKKTKSIDQILKHVNISRATLYSYLRHEGVEIGSFTKNQKTLKKKVMPVSFYLRVENNSKHVRGKKRSIEAIERFVFSHYTMKKSKVNEHVYNLEIPYTNEKDLDDTVYDIIQEADSQADVHNCFIEVDVQALDGSDKSWY
jgi:DNA invertase Pin-like site-specific DNA recombinase